MSIYARLSNHSLKFTMNLKSTCLIGLILLFFSLHGMSISLQPAFYPTEAESKGATPSQYGLVFGIYSLSSFLFSPVFGRFGNKVGPRLLYISGGFLQAACNVAFGCLAFVNNTAFFIGASYCLRFLEGVANVACNSSVLVILMALYPDRGASLTAITESTMGLGYMMGPVIGSLFYTLGGFVLPFFVVGFLLFVVTVILIFVVPNVSKTRADQSVESNGIKQNGHIPKKTLTFLDVIKGPLLFLPIFDIFIGFCGNGMVESMLEPHMKESEAQATQMDVSIAFLILGGSYMASSLVSGRISDKLTYPVVISMTGNIIMGVSFLFLGPAPYLPLLPSSQLAWVVNVGVGVGYAMILVSTFARINQAVASSGFAIDMKSNLLLTGCWLSGLHLGNFVGPTAAGILVDAVGFRNTTVVYQLLYVLTTSINIGELAYSVRRRRGQVGKYETL